MPGPVRGTFETAFLQRMGGLACVVGGDGLIEGVGPGWARVLGRPATGFVGHPLVDFVHPEDRERVASAADTIFTSPGGVEFVARWVAASGSWRTFAWRSGPAVGKAHALALLVDVSELATRASHLADIVDHDVGLVITHDLRGVILEVNRRGAILLEHEVHELVGRSLATLLAPGPNMDFDAYLRRIEESGAAEGTMVLVSRSGNRLHFEYRNSLRRWEDRDPWVVGHAVHVTRRIHAEAQLRQAQKFELLGHMVGGIAHDFNNLLTIIIGNADSLRDDSSLAGAELRERVDDILGAAVGGAGLVGRLMGFIRKADLDLSPLDMADAVRRTLDLVRPTLPETIELRYEAEPDLPAVMGDAVAVQQMLLNLATNARDAMPDGGVLAVRAEVVTVSAAQDPGVVDLTPGPYLRITMEDSGVGMEPSVLEHVFEPFFTTKAQGGGTGLGLATTYAIMRQLRGTVHASSEVGVGSVFSLYFPLIASALPASQAAPPRAPSWGEGGQITVLPAEDNESLRRMAAMVLRRMGHRVLAAENGHRALEVFHRHRGEIDLVLSDLVMPVMGGAELLARIRAEDADVPFLLTSGYGEGAPTLDAGVELLPKPWTVAELAERIRRLSSRGGAEGRDG